MDLVTTTTDVFFLSVRAFQSKCLPPRPKQDVAKSFIPENHNRILVHMQNDIAARFSKSVRGGREEQGI